jgi:hypothetical protein
VTVDASAYGDGGDRRRSVSAAVSPGLNFAARKRYTPARDPPDHITMADRDGPDGSQRRSLIALGVVVVLFLVGWLLAHELYASGKLEDCLMSGRTNCVPLETQGR